MGEAAPPATPDDREYREIGAGSQAAGPGVAGLGTVTEISDQTGLKSASCGKGRVGRPNPRFLDTPGVACYKPEAFLQRCRASRATPFPMLSAYIPIAIFVVVATGF